MDLCVNTSVIYGSKNITWSLVILVKYMHVSYDLNKNWTQIHAGLYHMDINVVDGFFRRS